MRREENSMEQTPPGPWQWLSQTFAAVSVYADTNLNVLRQLTDFSANVAKENVSLGAALQASTIEALQEGQAYVFGRLSALSEVPQHPLHYSQSSLHESAASAEKGLKLLQDNTHAILGAIEQYWITARQTSSSIQASYAQLADKLKGLYTPA
jgi:hypothetical protein